MKKIIAVSERSGFTLLELIVYLVLFGIVGTLAASVLSFALRGKTAVGRLNEVQVTAQRTLEQIIDRVHTALAINDASSTLSLKMSDSSKDPTIYALAGGAVTIKEGSAAAVPVTPPSTVVTALTFGKAQNPTVSITNGLVGWWPFDEGAGASTTDASGNGNTGTINGATWTSGKLGQALQFDGVSDNVQIAYAPSINNLNSVTYSAWVYPRSAGGSSTGNVMTKRQIQQIYISGGKWRYFETCNGPNLTRTSATSVTYNQWQHIVVTLNGTLKASDLHIYRDGILDDGVDGGDGGTHQDNFGYPQTIGAYWSNGQYPFDGLIDDVRIYNRVLSDAEIESLFRTKPNDSVQITVTSGYNNGDGTADPNTVYTLRTTALPL